MPHGCGKITVAQRRRANALTLTAWTCAVNICFTHAGVCLQGAVLAVQSGVCALHFLFVNYFWRCPLIAAKSSSLINEEIRANEVRVIGADGTQLGVMKLAEAFRLANEAELDLVQIAPDSVPPVCKIMDYGKFRFEKEKREKEQRKKRQVIELKEIQLKCRIDTHDFNTKLNHALRFLYQGNKVKVIVKFFGREMAHTELGAQLLDRFAAGCGEAASIEKPAVLDGRNMTMILAPKKTK
jgi:translation initiation factor IF-3